MSDTRCIYLQRDSNSGGCIIPSIAFEGVYTLYKETENVLAFRRTYPVHGLGLGVTKILIKGGKAFPMGYEDRFDYDRLNRLELPSVEQA